MKKLTIAIDGYSSCGKSTLAKAVAHELHYVFIDSGAMYRAVTFYALQNGIIANGSFDKDRLIAELDAIHIEFGPRNEDESHPVLLNDVDITTEIRGIELSSWVSDVAAVKEVRQKMVAQQQRMGRKGGVVMDGRDIGTVVFPNAELKLFLTASIEVRTQRRFDELVTKGTPGTFEEVKENLQKRDHIDSTRTESPLRQAEDAIVIDNTELTIEEQLVEVINLVNFISLGIIS